MTATGLIGLRIRDRRKALAITQVELARRIGISASYLNLIEADKRAIGGSLLGRVASALGLDLDDLTGIDERRLAERLTEVAGDPQLAEHTIDPETAALFVSRQPAWAQAFLQLWRNLRASAQQLDALAQRLDQDPNLAATVHNLLNQATTIRSTSEVLDTVDDLTEAERDRFVDIILSRSSDLSTQAELLVGMFEAGPSLRTFGTPSEEVDDLFIRNNAWFPDLEAAAEALRHQIQRPGRAVDALLQEYLTEQLGYRIVMVSGDTSDLSGFRNSVRVDRLNRQLNILKNAPLTTTRFQMTRLIAEITQQEAIAPILKTDILTSDTARQHAARALASHLAASVLMPYEPFFEDAERSRYDVDALAQIHGCSIEQICVRLLGLRKPDQEGVPFGFLRTDPSGHISKRFPIPGLPLPGSGNGCPLWPIYTAFQTPDRTLRQLAEFPNGGRFLFIARTVRHERAVFNAAPFHHALMLGCDVAYADRTIYGDDLALHSGHPASPVGPTCRLCARLDCQYRGEPSIVASRNDQMT